jgi:predicted transcriptional regulator
MNSFSDQFRLRVEAFLKAFGFKPTEFGRQALGDPSFVMNLRRGRSPTLTTADKVLAFMASFENRATNEREQSHG